MGMIAVFVLGALAAIALPLSPARAQNQEVTWVSGTGSDTRNDNTFNTCANQAAPCGSISGALFQTAAGGTINVLPGSYSAFTINKAVEIIAEPNHVVVSRGGNGAPDGALYGIVVSPGPGDVVRIRGITINQEGLSNFGGIYFQRGAALHLENLTLVRNSAPALNVATSSTASITVRNTAMNSNVGGNVQIKPSNNALVVATFENNLFANSPYGIRADNSGGSGKIIVDVKNSIAKGNGNNGYLAVGTGASPVHFMLDRATAESNGAYGAVATGPQAFMIVGNSTLMSNGTGLAQLNGATVASYGNNSINFNTTNTAGTITPIAQK